MLKFFRQIPASLQSMILERFVIKDGDSLFPAYEPKDFNALKTDIHFQTVLEAHKRYWNVVQVRYADYL